MTSTKVIYAIAAIVPFGFVALALFACVHTLRQRSQRAAAFKSQATSNFGGSRSHSNTLCHQGRCMFLR